MEHPLTLYITTTIYMNLCVCVSLERERERAEKI